MQIRDLIAELAAFDPTCRVETDGGHEVTGVQRGQRTAKLILELTETTENTISHLETELNDAEDQVDKLETKIGEQERLAQRLLEALQHVESCRQCAEADWQDCDRGGKEAWQAKRDAEKELKM